LQSVGALTATLTAITVFAAAGCADFSQAPPSATVQATLSPAAMHPKDEGLPLLSSLAQSTAPSSGQPSATGTAPSVPSDPCRPPDLAIIAACLTTPWGLAVLPDGESALVGERTTGRILRVVPQEEPVLVTTVSGIDTSGDGGLLGLAISAHYAEDGLLFAYITTPTDNRIVRIAPDGVAKPIFTGIPRGATHNGGRIAFAGDGRLYILTGDAGVTGAGADPGSLAGKVLRIDEFGKPVPETGSSTSGTASPTTAAPTSPAPTTAPSTSAPLTTSGAPTTVSDAVYARGLSNPTGICVLGSGKVAIVERRGAADALIEVGAGADLGAAPALWSFNTVDGGAVDCTTTETQLGATSLDQQLITTLTLNGNAFVGQPQQLVKGTYGRLLSLESGTNGLMWATTSNKDGNGVPQPRDDMVVVIPTGGGGGGGLD
jgi:glucose/arabinose dehydrogenase